jgi:hypothetical protein
MRESYERDPLALVVSLNVKRRNLNAGQRAIAAAEAWDLTPKNLGGGKGTAAARLADAESEWAAALAHADALLHERPEP